MGYPTSYPFHKNKTVVKKDNTPFTKTSPSYPHKNNAANSIKIAFTNSELLKIIHTLFTSAH